MKRNSWVHLLTYVTGLVNQELLLQNEDLAAENRILWAQLPAPQRSQNTTWRATRRSKALETWSAGDTRCTIGTRSSAIRFERP